MQTEPTAGLSEELAVCTEPLGPHGLTRHRQDCCPQHRMRSDRLQDEFASLRPVSQQSRGCIRDQVHPHSEVRLLTQCWHCGVRAHSDLTLLPGKLRVSGCGPDSRLTLSTARHLHHMGKNKTMLRDFRDHKSISWTGNMLICYLESLSH